MKTALLIIPEAYSLKDTVEMGLKSFGYDLKYIDYRAVLKKSKIQRKVETVLTYGKDKFAKVQEQANQLYVQEFDRLKPDLVFIYNDEAVTRTTLQYFRKSAKVIILLGDNPLTLNPPNKDNVAILFEADRVVCADSAWQVQLERIGLNNIVYDYLTYNATAFAGDEDLTAKREKDILFVGRTYQGAWGYKRCLFLNQFIDLDIDIYGSGAHWVLWQDTFPGIGKKLIYDKSKLPFSELTELMLSYKVFPVDANPGIVNGLHLRIFECIAAGILPLIEYTKDIDHVFKGVTLPLIHNYRDCKTLAEQYIQDEEGRIKILKEARAYLEQNYSPEIVMGRILTNI